MVMPRPLHIGDYVPRYAIDECTQVGDLGATISA
jgi:hypothetical protein